IKLRCSIGLFTEGPIGYAFVAEGASHFAHHIGFSSTCCKKMRTRAVVEKAVNANTVAFVHDIASESETFVLEESHLRNRHRFIVIGREEVVSALGVEETMNSRSQVIEVVTVV